MKFDRPTLRPFATIVASMLVMVACQNSTEPSVNANDPVVATVQFGTSPSRAPDSSAWKTKDSSGSQKITCSGAPDATSLICTETFHLPHPLGNDSLALELWTLGVRTGTIYLVEKGGPTVLKASSIYRDARDVLDTLLLHKYDSLPKPARDSFAVLGGGASGLVSYYASLILAGDPSFTGKPLPAGMSQDAVNTNLVYWFRVSGGTSNVLVTLKLDSATVQNAISALIKAKVLTPADSSTLFPPYPVRVIEGISVDENLSPGGKPVAVSGKFVWNKGTSVRPVVQVRTVSPGDSVNFQFPTRAFLSSDTILDLSGNLTLQALSQALPGIDTLVFTLSDDFGHQVVSRTTFTVASNAAAPSIAPNGGTFYSTQNATVTASGSDSIQISTDSATWTKYASSVAISASEKLFARSFKGGVASPVTSASFIIGNVPVPSITPNGGSFYGTDTVVVAAAGSDSIQVSTDSATWAKYTTKLVLTSTGKLHARAFKGGVASSVTSASFTSSAVPVPTIAPNGGTFYTTQSVSVTAPAGADSLQTSTDSITWTKYTSAVMVSASGELFARSFKSGVASSVVSASFLIGSVPMPSISPNGGSFYGTTTVTVSAAGSDSIQISTDSTTWTRYASALVVSWSGKLHARAFKGGVASSVVSASFASSAIPVPTIAPNGGTFYSTQSVSVTAPTGTDSVQTSKDSVSWSKFTQAISIASSGKLYARSYAGGVASPVVSAVFTIAAVPVPSISPNGGTFYAAQNATVTAAGTDSIETSTDSATWVRYTSAVAVSASGKLYARAYKGGVASTAVSASFTIATVPVPSISPNGGAFYSTQNVTVSAAGSDSIMISTDSLAWSRYTSVVPVSASRKLYARAMKGSGASSVVSASFTIAAVPPPSISPNGGPLSSTQAVSITIPAITGAVVEYSLGTLSGWIVYTQPLTVSSSTKVFAHTKLGGITSAVAEADFAFPPSLIDNVANDTVTNLVVSVDVAVSAAGSDSIMVSANGAAFRKLTGSIYQMSASGTLKAYSMTGSAKSAETSIPVNLYQKPPSISPEGGAFLPPQTVRISAPSGGQIFYTTNGTTPTTVVSATTSLYQGPFPVEATTMIIAIAVKTGCVTSMPDTATFSMADGTTFGIPWSSANYGVMQDLRDGTVYRTVDIGTQTWMAQNLNFAGNGTMVGICPEGKADSCAKYGRIYTWQEATGGTSSTASPSGVQGVCPLDWHVPSEAEWTTMQTIIDATGATDGSKLKSTTGWSDNEGSSGNGIDDYGFRALPGGLFGGTVYGNVGLSGSWWTASISSASTFITRGMSYTSQSVSSGMNFPGSAVSVRCVKN